MTSQVDPKHWHQLLGEPTVADAIVDRIIQLAHKIVLKGPSKRKDDTTTSQHNDTSVASLRPDPVHDGPSPAFTMS